MLPLVNVLRAAGSEVFIDVQKDVGSIKNTFIEFQKHLYQIKEAA